MEVGLIDTLQKHAADAKGSPKVRAALARHVGETRRHAAEMKKALASMGGSHPYVREGVSKLANLAAGLVTTAAKDTVIKNALTDFATEHFEIACYSSLIFTAQALGEKQIAATCKRILKEEKAMAAELAGQLKAINDAYLATLDKGEAEPVKPARGKRQNRSRASQAAAAAPSGRRSAARRKKA